MSTRSERRRKAEKIRHLLETEGDAVQENVDHLNQGRYGAIERFDEFEDLRTAARQIKEDAIENLPALIDELRASVEANGGTLYVADDAEDANRYVTDVVASKDADTLVKSKSMTTEEIDVNEALEATGVDVWGPTSASSSSRSRTSGPLTSSDRPCTSPARRWRSCSIGCSNPRSRSRRPRNSPSSRGTTWASGSATRTWA